MTIPNGAPTSPTSRPYTDLHNHLLPAIDDGARNLTESITCLRALASEGVGTVVTTPHLILPRLGSVAAVEWELARHRRAFDTLVAATADEDGLPDLALGQEIWAPTAELIAAVLGCEGLGLAGTQYLLVEFGFDLAGTHLDVIDEVVQTGRRIVVAHAERYHFPEDLDPLETATAWRDAGALLQVNTGSLSGYYNEANPGSQQLAWEMVDAGLVDVIATDHHGLRRSRGSPRQAHQALAAAGNGALLDEAMGATPARLLAGTLVTAR